MSQVSLSNVEALKYQGCPLVPLIILDNCVFAVRDLARDRRGSKPGCLQTNFLVPFLCGAVPHHIGTDRQANVQDERPVAHRQFLTAPPHWLPVPPNHGSAKF